MQILPVRGIGEVTPGVDLAALIVEAAPWLRDDDVLVVTSKIISKAEGRLVELPPPGPQRDQARADIITAETARLVASRGPTQIVTTHHGFVMAAAGIDASNVDSSHLVLLPKDPDGSARGLRASLAARHGLRVAVIVSDTMGRPWRNGLTDVALGAAGIAPIRDHRGETDRYGNDLQLTQVAIVDELAAAADLVKGKTDGVPVAVVRGLPAGLLADSLLGHDADGPGVVAVLVRDPSQDMFSLGTAEARTAGLRAAATLPEQVDHPLRSTAPPEQVSEAAIASAIALVATVAAPGTQWRIESTPAGEPPMVRCTSADPTDPVALVRLGADVHRLQVALAAESITASVRQPSPVGTVLLRLAPTTT